MKIIGIVGRDSVLLEATKDELAQVMGESSTYSLDKKDAFEVGSEIKVNEIFEAIHEIKENKETVLELTEKLGGLAMAARKLARLKPFRKDEKEKA